MKLFTAALTFFCTLLLACGGGTLDGGSDIQRPYACDSRAIESTCAAFPVGFTKAEADASCEGTLIETSCPLDGAVGICTVALPKGGQTATNTYYSDGPEPQTEPSARKICEEFFEGTFWAAAGSAWIGDSCQAAVSCGYEGATCATDYPGGVCTKLCTGDCPTKEGRAPAFCAGFASSGGYCLQECNPSVSACREGYACVRLKRQGATDASDSKYVCTVAPK